MLPKENRVLSPSTEQLQGNRSPDDIARDTALVAPPEDRQNEGISPAPCPYMCPRTNQAFLYSKPSSQQIAAMDLAHHSLQADVDKMPTHALDSE